MGIFKISEEKVEEPEIFESAEPVKASVEEPEDRSLYNCDACGGDGLLLDEANKLHVICPRCNGTGKLG